jgi:2-pyrone-4,6-dicarboxylate lactonase
VKGACDTHFHVFGPPERYPARDPKLRYQPPHAPLEDYLAQARQMGFERFVLVQPSAYLRDNGCMLDAMRRLPGSRGIVDVDENAPDAELEAMHKAGVRGVRVNVSPVHPPETGLSQKLLPRIVRLDARCAELGWSLDFLLPGWLTAELLARMEKLKAPFTMAHMGMFLAKDGPSQLGFQRLIRMLKNKTGYVKLTGAYRMSQAPGFADAAPLARALIEAAPDRLVWGSDYPHLSFADQVTTQQLFDLLKQWCGGDQLALQKILVNTPAKLYGF